MSNQKEIKDIKPSNLATKIDKNCWISGYIPSYNKEFLEKADIKRIIRCFDDRSDTRPRIDGIKYLVIPADDVSDYPLYKHFDKAMEFINEGISNSEVTLVHCHAGISRSATIILVYLMCLGLNIFDAYRLLRHHRSFINPNAGFTEQLVKWRYHYYGKQKCEEILKKLNELKQKNNE